LRRVEEGSGQIDTGEDRGSLRWAWVLTIVLGAFDFIWADRIGLSFVGRSRVFLMVAPLIAIGAVYRYSRPNPRLSDAGNYAALGVAFSAVGAIFTYLAATFALPLRDAGFVATDAVLGFHWLAWFDFIHAHRTIQVPLFIAYSSFLPQIVGSILYFAHTRQTARNAEMLWITMVSLILTTIGSALLPAVGPFVHFFGRPTEDIIALMSLRAGGAQTFVINQLQGIITFPSFHTVLAIIFVYVHRPPSRSFVPIALLNALMLIGIPSEGHHYLVDMISGTAVAAMSIAIVRAALPAMSNATTPAVRRRCVAS